MSDLSTKLDEAWEASDKMNGTSPLERKLDEILFKHGESWDYADRASDLREANNRAKEQILQAVTESLPDTLLSIEDGKSEHYARGYNQAIRDIKDRLEGER